MTEFGHSIFGSSLFAVLQATSMALLGVALARAGVVDAAVKKVLSAISMKVLIPCLLFSNLIACPQGGPQQDPALCPDFQELIQTAWPFLFLPAIWVAIGVGLGLLAAGVGKAPQHLRGVVVAACAFGNSTGLPIVLFPAISAAGLTEVDPVLQERMYLICLSVYQITYPMLQWTLAPLLLRDSSAHGSLDATSGVPALLGRTASGASISSTSSAGGDRQQPLHQNGNSQASPGRMKALAGAFCTPPVVAILAATAVCAVPGVRDILVDLKDHDNDAPLEWAFNAIVAFGKAAVPLNMLVLGAGLANIPDFSLIHWPSTAAAALMKMVIYPGIVFGLVFAMQSAGLIDRLHAGHAMQSSFVLVACLVTATPTANNLVVMAELSAGDEGKRALSAMIFVMYCCAPFLLALWLAAFIHLGSSADG